MSTWICLLRGVNLGARNKLNMPELRTALTEAGMQDVRTYIQSGNVIARSEIATHDDIAAMVGEVLSRRFDLNVPVIMRTPGELRRLLDWCPFRADAQERPTVVHLVELTAE